MNRIVLSLILFLRTIESYGASMIKGTLPGYPNTFVTVNKYTDYVIQNTEQIAQVKTDNKGYFEITGLEMPGTNRLKLFVQNESVSFYVNDGFVYTVIEKEKKLSVDEDKRGLNTALKSIDEDLFKTHPLWIDTTGRFILSVPPEYLLKKMDSIKYHYSVQDDTALNSQLDHYIAHTKIFFITTSYRIGDSADAVRAFAQLGNKYISNSPVQINDPFYTRLLRIYMSGLAGSAYFSHIPGEKSAIERGLAEAELFTNDSLKELAKAIVINLAYDGKWYKKEMMPEQFNEKANSIGKSFKIPLFQEYMKQIILANNKIKVGSIFPVIELQNVQQQKTDISKISAPYLLVDIWATWCKPCKEAMELFPALMEKYKGRLMITGISVDEHFDVMKKHLDEQHYTGKWEMLHNGARGNYYDKIIINHYPIYYLLDKDLRIIAIPESNELLETLETALN